MDFKEYLLKKNKSGKEIALSILIYFVAIVLSFFSFVFLLSFPGGLNVLVPAAILFGAHKLAMKFKKEFEYIITDDIVDIDVIFNQNSRKRLISFSIKQEAEILASVDDAERNAVLKGEFDEVIDATTNTRGADVYFVVVDKDAARKLVKFEPPYAALEILKKYAPSKVFIK